MKDRIIKDRIIIDIRIKDRIIRDITTPFEQEGDFYKPIRVGNFGIIIILNMKVMVIDIKAYH